MAARGLGAPATSSSSTRMVLTRSKAKSQAKADPSGGDSFGDDVAMTAGGAEDGGEAAEETTTVVPVRETLSERAASLRLRASSAASSADPGGSDLQMSPRIRARLAVPALASGDAAMQQLVPLAGAQDLQTACARSRSLVQRIGDAEARKKRRRRGLRFSTKPKKASIRAAQQLRKPLSKLLFGTNIIGRIMDVRYTHPPATYRVQVTGFDGANGWHTVDSAGLGTLWLGDDFTDLIDVNKMYAGNQITFLDKNSLTATSAPLPKGYTPATTTMSTISASRRKVAPAAPPPPRKVASTAFGADLVGAVLDITYPDPDPATTYRMNVTKYIASKKWHSVISTGPVWEGTFFTDTVDINLMHAEGCVAIIEGPAPRSTGGPPPAAGASKKASAARPRPPAAQPSPKQRASTRPAKSTKATKPATAKSATAPSEPLSLRDGRIVPRFGNDVVGRVADLLYTNPDRKVRVCVTSFDPGTECHSVASVATDGGFQDEVHLSAMFAAGKAFFVDPEEVKESAESAVASPVSAKGPETRKGSLALAKPFLDKAKAKTSSAKAKKKAASSSSKPTKKAASISSKPTKKAAIVKSLVRPPPTRTAFAGKLRKKAKSGFSVFCDEKRPALMEKARAEAAAKGETFNYCTSVGKALPDMWKSLSAEEREPFEKMSSEMEDKHRKEAAK